MRQRSLVRLAPVYYVTGNHEFDSDWLRELLKVLGSEGVTVLRNSYVPLTSGTDVILLAGLDDPNGPKDMKKPLVHIYRLTVYALSAKTGLKEEFSLEELQRAMKGKVLAQSQLFVSYSN